MGKWVVLLFGWFGLTGVASGGAPVWFNHGVAPLEVVAPPGQGLSSRECRNCHSRVFDDWSKSRHSAAWTNEVFQEGFLAESQDRCIFCHAPMNRQFVAIRKRTDDPLPHEGVNCATCHIRDGQIFTTAGSGESMHASRQEPLLKKPEFCAGCHQFNFNRQVDGTSILEPLVVQNTYQEWLDYRKAGGTKTCQQCHMPNGRHTFPGAHDPETLNRSLSVEVKRRGKRVQVLFKAIKVGHLVPSGDLFRHFTFEIRRDGEEGFRTLYEIGKRYALRIDERTGEAIQSLSRDTALRPFENRRMSFEIDGPFLYRVRYHYTSRKNELISLLKPEELTKTVVSGSVSP